jgi:cell division septation protein DedD
VSEHDDPTEEHELYEEVPPRSIFAATWFRVLLVVIVIGVIGAVAIPYVLDFMNPPPSRPTTAAKPPSPPVAIPATPSSPAADKSDASAPTVLEPKPAPPAARPVEPKPTAPKADSRTAAVPADKSKSAMAVTETSPPKSTTPSAKPAPAAKPDTATKPDAPTKPDTTTKSDTMAKPDAMAKTAMPAPKTDTPSPKADTPSKDVVAKADTAKPAVAAKSAATPKRAATTATTTAKAPAGTGPFWVQVGAFKDAETAKKVAAKLREDNFTVEESVTRKGGGAPAKPAPMPAAPAAPAAKPDITADQYDVLVSGQTPEELNKRLAAKGLAAEASGGGMVVKPSLPLRDAVALSKDLAVEGFKVQVRRAGGSMGSASPAPTPTPAPAAAAPTESGSELHRVRVGGFADRAAAVDVVRQLEAKGYKPYIARGDQ